MKPRGAWVLFTISLTLDGCGYLAEHTAPRKEPTQERTAAAQAADRLFWGTLHSGKYDQIQPALEAETAAYLGNPSDAISAAHVAWLHIWRLSERARLASLPASITDDAFLARRYFEEAVVLNPREPRFLGFLASATLADGHINQDENITRRGYFMMLDAIKAWPEFNLFTGGYVLSDLPADSKNFKQALQWQWRDIEICIGEKFDRKNPDFSRYMHLETRKGRKRACWNSWIAPPQFRGLFHEHGRHAGEVRRLADRPADLRDQQTLIDLRRMALSGCAGAKNRQRAGKRCGFSCPGGYGAVGFATDDGGF
jgi:hypothetical protein